MATDRSTDDPLTHAIIGAAMTVHSTLGPGLLEAVYERCLAFELRERDIYCETQVELPVKYGDIVIENGYRLDIVVERQVILELKAVRAIDDIARAQLLTYMKLSGLSKGLIINFNVTRLVDGIKRFKL